MRAATLVVVVALALASGCATTSHVTTSIPHDALVVDGAEFGAVPPTGLDVDVKHGPGPVAWTLKEHGAVVAQGQVVRTEPVWWILGVGIGGAVCCVPTLAATSFCVVNPTALLAPLSCLIAGPGALLTALAAPGWLSLPAACAGAVVGASPLLLAFVGQTVPSTLSLEAPLPSLPSIAPAGSPPAASPPAAQSTPPVDVGPATAPAATSSPSPVEPLANPAPRGVAW